MIARLTERPWRFGHRPPDAVMSRDGLVNVPERDSRLWPLRAHGAWMGGQRNSHGAGAPDTPPASGAGREICDRWAASVAARCGPTGFAAGSSALPMGPPAEDTRSLVLRATTYPAAVVPFTKASDFEPTFEEQLRKELGTGYGVDVTQTADPTAKAISIGGPLFSDVHDSGVQLYDARIKFPDGYAALFRVTRYSREELSPCFVKSSSFNDLEL